MYQRRPPTPLTYVFARTRQSSSPPEDSEQREIGGIVAYKNDMVFVDTWRTSVTPPCAILADVYHTKVAAPFQIAV